MEIVPKRVPDLVATTKDIGVPEAANAKALRFQPGIPHLVIGVSCMLATIGFDDQSLRWTHEIDDIGTDLDLPTELETTEPPVAQEEPKFALGFCRLLAHRARALAELGTQRQRVLPFSPCGRRWPRSGRMRGRATLSG